MTPTGPNERARELKPCPCGRAARIYDVSVVVETRGKKVVSCDDPECHWSMTGYGDEQVAERWNRRALSHAAAVEGGEAYTTGHCENHKKPGGCHLHNLHCGWPQCDRRPATPPPAPAAVAGGDAEEDAYVIDALAHLLAEISIIVNGPEPAGTKWSYHDLPEKVRALAAQPAVSTDTNQKWIDRAEAKLAAQQAVAVTDAYVEAVWNALPADDIPTLTRRKLRSALTAALERGSDAPGTPRRKPAAGDKVRELVEKWRRYADGNFDDAANARSRCADELEAALGQGKANG